MDGIADMGGTEGWGRTHPPRLDEPVFPEAWQGRAFALALLSNRLAGRNLDSFRHALERLDRTAYLDDGYSGRWLNGAELMLTDTAVLAPRRSTPAPATYAVSRSTSHQRPNPPSLTPHRPPKARCVRGRAPAFAMGERVRAKDISPAGHTRLPRYVRGHTGLVVLVQPASVLPDTNAHFQGENPQYVYTVRFDSRELWGADAEPFALTIEMFESYLEKAA